MSSDPFADLADSLSNFAHGLLDLLNANRLPAPGSPAAAEADGEPYIGEWGATPSIEVFSSAILMAWSSADHLTATAAAISARSVIAAPYTLTRAAVESAATACYLSEVGISPLERVRRNMNCRLAFFGACLIWAGRDLDNLIEGQPAIEGLERLAAAIGCQPSLPPYSG